MQASLSRSVGFRAAKRRKRGTHAQIAQGSQDLSARTEQQASA
jgi:hypothetical protein